MTQYSLQASDEKPIKNDLKSSIQSTTVHTYRVLTQKEKSEISSIISNSKKIKRKISELEPNIKYLNQFGRKKLTINKQLVSICDTTILSLMATGIDNFNNSDQSTELLFQAKDLYAEQLMLEDILENKSFQELLITQNTIQDVALDDLILLQK